MSKKRGLTVAEMARMGGNARAKKLNARERSEISKRAAAVRWFNRANESACIYFLLDLETNLVKIGCSNRPNRRASVLGAGAGQAKKRILGCISARRWAESVIHEKFRPFHSHGEWFRMDDSVAEFIRKNGVTRTELWVILDRSHHLKTSKELARETSLSRMERFDIAEFMAGCVWRDEGVMPEEDFTGPAPANRPQWTAAPAGRKAKVVAAAPEPEPAGVDSPSVGVLTPEQVAAELRKL